MSYIHHTEFKKVSDSTILCGHCQKETDHVVIDVELQLYAAPNIEMEIKEAPVEAGKQLSYSDVLDKCFRKFANEENMEYTPYLALSLFEQIVYDRCIDRCPNCHSSGTLAQ